MKTTKKLSSGLVFGLTGMVLALVLVLTGCPTDIDTDESDTWSAVTSLSQVNGTWEWSYNQTMAINEFWGESDISWAEKGNQLAYGDMLVTETVAIIMTIDASEKTITSTRKTTHVYFDGNIDTMWIFFPLSYLGLEEVTFDDATHSVTITESGGTRPTDVFPFKGAQINQTGTVIKLPANSLGEGLSEVLFIKQ
ncbi:hypothetical protein AGMMS49991_00680 [Spirochaetia bacterium]|nr:hypothetical protein AGMMS49991_00680 [Spirochaetia bacterium]